MKTFFAALCLLCCTSLWGAKKVIKIACIGNSITYGTGLADRRTHDAYPVQLQRMLGDGYRVENFGKPGATLLRRGHRPYMQQKEFFDALAFQADVAVIHLGINDTDPRDWPNYRDDFVSDYLALIDSLKKHRPGMRIIIAKLTPIADRHPRFRSGTKLWHDEIQKSIEQVAQLSGAQLTDFHRPLYAYPYLLADAVHPNAEGAGLLAQTVYSAITGRFGGLQVSSLYTDYMVLQRNVPLRIQGTADSGEKITVSIGNQKRTAVTNRQGQWKVLLEPLEAGTDYQLCISSPSRKLTFRHVAAGEVWLCSGQSNMEFRLSQAATARQDIPQAADSLLRLFDMKGRWTTSDTEWSISAIDSTNHLLYYKETAWAPSTPASAASFSAVAYYFGKMLRDSLQVPVGLICNAVGGSTTESWIDRQTLETQFPAILKDWMHNDFIQDWARGRAAVNLKKATIPMSRHPYEPCYLYESGIDPLRQFPIKGVIWYQGESNAHNFEAHEKLFHLLVDSWRKNWERPELPFYYVQLSSLSRPSWPWFRDSQRRLMHEIPHSGMAVSSDKGDSLDVHPRFKKEIGQRLARWALHDSYRKPLLPSGPLFAGAHASGAEAIVRFRYAEGMRPASGTQIVGFEIAEFDGLFHPATATVKGDCIYLTSPHVKHPRLVRYAWQPFTRANLVNEKLLPASTFRAEF